MAETRYVSEIFSIQPPNWGLRGDPYLWKDMQAAFAEVELPYDSPSLVADIKRIFQEKTGMELDVAARPFVAEYDHGGASSGKVSGRFWLITAMPLLVAMRDIYEGNPEEFDQILRDGTARFLLQSQPCQPQ